MALKPEENSRSVLPEDPLEGMGDLSAIDPVAPEPLDQPAAENMPADAAQDMDLPGAGRDIKLLPLLAAEEDAAVEPASDDIQFGGEALSLDQIIASIDEEIESGLEPLRDVKLKPVPEPESEEAQFISFSLAGTDYAVSIQNVTEIAYVPDLTPLPNVPPWILGVANLRGDLLSIVDLRAFFGLERTTLTGTTRMLVARTTDEDIAVGLLVDQAQGLRNLRISEIEKPTGDIESQIAPYLYGAYDSQAEMLVLLDLDRVLLSPSLRQFEPQVV